MLLKMAIFYSFILVFVFSTAIRSDSVAPTNELEEGVLSLLNKWRKGAVETNLFPLPSLKAIKINTIASNYDENGIRISFSIGDMTLMGLDNFSVESLNVTQTLDGIHVTAKVFIPLLTLYSDSYNLNGRAYFFYSLRGHGKMSFLFHDVELSLSVQFANVGGVGTKIDAFVLKFKVGKLDANLANSSWPINQVLNRDGAEIIKSYHDEIVNFVRENAVPYADDYIANISPGQFSKILAEINANSYVVGNNIK